MLGIMAAGIKNGVHNVAALVTLISQQEVDYDFQFCRLEYHAL
jgi:hypothetical protein